MNESATETAWDVYAVYDSLQPILADHQVKRWALRTALVAGDDTVIAQEPRVLSEPVFVAGMPGGAAPGGEFLVGVVSSATGPGMMGMMGTKQKSDWYMIGPLFLSGIRLGGMGMMPGMGGGSYSPSQTFTQEFTIDRRDVSKVARAAAFVEELPASARPQVPGQPQMPGMMGGMGGLGAGPISPGDPGGMMGPGGMPGSLGGPADAGKRSTKP